MLRESAALLDSLAVKARRMRDREDRFGIVGFGIAELFDENGDLKELVPFANLVTEYGDQFYGDRAAAIGSQGVVSGMRLGTGTTAVAKTGAGAAIVTYTGSLTFSKAIDGSFPTSALSGSSRRITWKTTWNAGEATASGLAEAVVTNRSPLGDVAGVAGDTISRALLSPVVNKGASDTLAITWNHDLLGA